MMMNRLLRIRADLRERFPTLTRRSFSQGVAAAAAVPSVFIGRAPDGRRVELPLRQRQEHVLMLGATNSGKSSLLLHYLRQAIKRGEGLLFLDPHGSHPDSAYRNLLVGLKDRPVHVIDFNAPYVVGFNPLACPAGTDASVVVGNVMDALAITWEGESFTQKPTIERNLSAVLTALVELGLTFCEAPYLLDRDDAHGLRRHAIDHVRDPHTREELKRLHELSQDGRRRRDFDQEVIGPGNRLARLLRPPTIRAMLGQTENCIDLKTIMDGGGIVLANLSGGSQAYERDTDLFGRLLTRTALFHAKRRENARPFNLVLDEAHRYLSSDIPVLLAEIRKYGVSLVAAMQWLDQADKNILPALLKGPGCKICFRLRDAEEAERVARTIVPLNLERPVAALIRPTVVGHRRIHLSNESESEQRSRTASQSKTTGRTVGSSATHGETEGYTDSRSESAARGVSHSDSTSTGESTGKSSGTAEVAVPRAHGDDVVTRVSASSGSSSASSHTKGHTKGQSTVKTSGQSEAYSYSVSRSKTRSVASTAAETTGEASTHGTGRSRGSSEALEPVLEDRPSAVHGIQNELYAAGLLLRSLPTAVGYLNYVGKTGQVATLFTVPPVFSTNVSDEAFEEIRNAHLHGVALSAAQAAEAVAEREREILARAEPPPKPKRKPSSVDKNIERGATW